MNLTSRNSTKENDDLALNSDDARKSQRFPTKKKLAGLAGVILCVLLLILVGIQAITWRLFWAAIILIAGFAYFILPKMAE